MRFTEMSFRGNSLLLYVEYMSEAVLDYFNLSKGVGSVLLLSFSTSTDGSKYFFQSLEHASSNSQIWILNLRETFGFSVVTTFR